RCLEVKGLRTSTSITRTTWPSDHTAPGRRVALMTRASVAPGLCKDTVRRPKRLVVRPQADLRQLESVPAADANGIGRADPGVVDGAEVAGGLVQGRPAEAGGGECAGVADLDDVVGLGAVEPGGIDVIDRAHVGEEEAVLQGAFVLAVAHPF